LIVQNALDEVQSTKDREMSELSQTAAELHQAIAHLNIAAPDGGGNVSPLKRVEKETSPATTTNATNALPSAAPAVALPTAPSRAEPSSDGSNGQQPGGESYARFHIPHLILSGRGAYPHDTGPTAAVPSDADVDHIGVATRATAEGTGGGC